MQSVTCWLSGLQLDEPGICRPATNGGSETGDPIVLESPVLDQLRLEHLRMSQLLAILEKELNLFDESEVPDYEVINEIIEYFADFPDRCHHPKEDAIYRRLKEVNPALTDKVGDLEAEHLELAEKLQLIATVVRNVIDGGEVSRSRVHEVISDFIVSQRRHLATEERTFFRLAKQALTETDWTDVQSTLSREMDPLVESSTMEKFENLRHRIVDWAKEDQPS